MPALAAITGAVSCLVVSCCVFSLPSEHTRSSKNPSLELGIAGGVKEINGAESRVPLSAVFRRSSLALALAARTTRICLRPCPSNPSLESRVSFFPAATWMMLLVSVSTVHDRHISSAGCPLSKHAKPTVVNTPEPHAA